MPTSVRKRWIALLVAVASAIGTVGAGIIEGYLKAKGVSLPVASIISEVP